MNNHAKQRRARAMQRQTARLERRLSVLEHFNTHYTWVRLVVFIVGFLISGALFFVHGPLFWVPAAALWLSIFSLVVHIHRRFEEALKRHRIWLILKKTHLARMELDWNHLPAPLLVEWSSDHPFVADLDLVGPRSLHHLLDVAVSYNGSLRLQQWLLDNDPQLDVVTERQQLVREIAPLVLFRDRLALVGRLTTEAPEERWQAAELLHWLQRPAPAKRMQWLLFVLLFLSAVNVVLFVLHQLGQVPAWWSVSLAVYVLLYLFLGRDIRPVFEEALSFQAALQQLRHVFSYLETYRYGQNQRLRNLCRPFLARDRRPSSQLRRISRVVNATGLSRNPVLWLVLNIAFPWDLYFAYRLHQLRLDVTDYLPLWLDCWFELEALNSLANLHYLNPHYVFPSLRQDPEAAPFQAKQLGHPLIPDPLKVRNDFQFEEIGQVDLITGSNMAGKSSFLRTLGINLRLAYSGGPVDANSLQTRLFRLYTSMRVADSVTDGISYFYAEVQRLKALLKALHAADDRPLFFLIDEIFRGTNNRERLLGSRAYIRTLTGKNGSGVIATHDLELVQLENDVKQLRNFHFRDAVEDGRMTFDYKLRRGPSPTTNALKIMELEGLPVPSRLDQDSDEHSS